MAHNCTYRGVTERTFFFRRVLFYSHDLEASHQEYLSAYSIHDRLMGEIIWQRDKLGFEALLEIGL